MRNHPLTTGEIFIVSIVLLLCAVPLLYKLDFLTYRAYDEATTGMNSYSLFKSRQFLIPTNDGNPELWNCKPPFLMWWHVLFMHLVGVNELALRLPSVIATLGCCWCMIYFSKKVNNNILSGVAASLVLVSTAGYMNIHVARTGDFDAMLTGLCAVYCMMFYLYLNATNPKKEKLYLSLFFLFLTCAFFTKSIASLLFLPILFIAALFHGSIGKILRSRLFYAYVISFISLVAAYYWYRNAMVPGFLSAMIDNEIVGRYKGGVDDHSGLWYYYIKRLISYDLKYWIWLLPLSVFSLLSLKKKNRKVSIYMLALLAFHHTVVSRSVTKLDWYIAPEYPFFAMLIGFGLNDLLERLNSHIQLSFALRMFIVLILALLPLGSILLAFSNSSDNHKYPNESPVITNFVRDSIQTFSDKKIFVAPGWVFLPDTRLEILSMQEKGVEIDNFHPDNSDFANKRFVILNKEFENKLKDNFHLNVLHQNSSLKVCDVFDKK